MFIGRADAEGAGPVPWPLDGNSGLIGKDPDAGKDTGRRREQQRMRCFNSIPNPMDMSLTKFWETVRDREAWLAVVHGVARVRHDLMTEQQPQWGTESLFCSHNILVADPGFRPACSLFLQLLNTLTPRCLSLFLS